MSSDHLTLVGGGLRRQRRRARIRTIRSSATATGSTSASTTRRWCSARCNSSGTRKKGDPGLAGKFKVGGWRHFGDFQRSAVHHHRPVACRSGVRRHARDAAMAISASIRCSSRSSIASDKDVDRGIGIFARASYSPPDRNLIDLYADAGIELVGLSDQRPQRQVRHRRRLCACIALGPRARRRFSAIEWPGVAGAELRGACYRVYQYEVRAGWTLQPNFQYIIHPGGGATESARQPIPGQALRTRPCSVSGRS